MPIYTSKKNSEILEKQGIVITSHLKEGDTIDLGSYKPLNINKWVLKVVELPVYTEGLIGFYDSRGILFSSSCLHKNLLTKVANSPKSYRNLVRSLSKIKKLHPKFVLSTHGEVIIAYKQYIKNNLSKRRLKEKQVLQVLKDGVTTIEEISNQVFSEIPKSQKINAELAVRTVLYKNIGKEKVIQRGEEYFWKNG
ncbi:MAG: hypothetical protein ACTSP3_04295 [Candidatus Heimdallarchaeaceae archaeon]